MKKERQTTTHHENITYIQVKITLGRERCTDFGMKGRKAGVRVAGVRVAGVTF